MRKRICLLWMIAVFVLSACAAPSAPTASQTPPAVHSPRASEEALPLTGFGAEEFLERFCLALEDDGLLTGEDALELAEAEEPGYRIIRRGGSKILIAAFEDDGIVLLSAFRTFREQEEACLRVFASAMRAFSSGESLEEAEETLRETYAAMGDHNTRTLYRGYAQFRLVTEADESAETGGYVYFLIGKS